MRLGVVFAWHTHPWETLARLVERAEELGYAAAFVDGDISMLDSSSERDVLDGWTATVALLARTRRIQIGSIRLVHHWNAARLAQAAAAAERIAPGRLRFLIGIGDRPHDERFGLPRLPPGERIRWLDETLTALRALWRGETVTLRGRHVTLEEARVRPAPPGGIPISVAAQGPRLLEVVAAHADGWDVNLPPIPARVERAAAALDAACRARSRDPARLERSMWIFARVGEPADPAAALAEYRRLNPWFDRIPDDEIRGALVLGSGPACRRRLRELARELRLELPAVDLSGLAAPDCLANLEALAPKSCVDASTWTS